MKPERIGEHVHKAEAMWAEMNSDEKFGCRFGVFPAEPMDKAEKEGFTMRLIMHELMHYSTQRMKNK